MKILLSLMILVSSTLSLAGTPDESILATPREFLNYRWQYELTAIKSFKSRWLKMTTSQEFLDCKEQNGSRWKWLSYDKCERHRKTMRDDLYQLFGLNKKITRQYDIYVNNIDDDFVRNSAVVQKSRELNYDAFHSVERALDMCISRADRYYTTEYNYNNNLNYYKSALSSIDCYYHYVNGKAQIVSGDGQ